MLIPAAQMDRGLLGDDLRRKTFLPLGLGDAPSVILSTGALLALGRLKAVFVLGFFCDDYSPPSQNTPLWAAFMFKARGTWLLLLTNLSWLPWLVGGCEEQICI